MTRQIVGQSKNDVEVIKSNTASVNSKHWTLDGSRTNCHPPDDLPRLQPALQWRLMRALSIVVAAAVLTGTIAFSASQEEAQAKAQAWLSLVDNQKYAESWAESSSMFRSRVPQQRWTDEVKRAREPL